MREGFDAKLKIFLSKNASLIWRAEQTGATQSFLRRRFGGVAPIRFAIFIFFFARDSLFSTVLITFRTFSELFERTELLKFKNHS